MQLDRSSKCLSDSSLANASATLTRVLGFTAYVSGRVGEPRLDWLLDGTAIAAYTAFGLDIRCGMRRHCTASRHRSAASGILSSSLRLR